MGPRVQLNGYCHMLTVKELLFLGEIPSELWPDGAAELRDACVAQLRDKQIFRSLPVESAEFNDLVLVRRRPPSARVCGSAS